MGRKRQGPTPAEAGAGPSGTALRCVLGHGFGAGGFTAIGQDAGVNSIV